MGHVEKYNLVPCILDINQRSRSHLGSPLAQSQAATKNEIRSEDDEKAIIRCSIAPCEPRTSRRHVDVSLFS